MEITEENLNQENLLKDMPIQSENIAYKAEELIVCKKCGRTNPPNRLKCFYCAAELEISAENAELIKPNLRKLETWEKGFNLIYRPQDSELAVVTEIAKLTNLEKETVQKIVEAKKSFPLVRCETEKEAEIVKKNLQRLGLESIIVSDENLAAEKLPTRLRGLDFLDDKLILIFFNADEIVEIAREDLVLIVSGAIFERKTESIKKRKKGESKILDATETASDEVLIDIYTRCDSNGYRIPMKGFDFSCLGADKRMIAAENLKKLTENLNEFAPNSKLVNDYLAIRESLGNIWEIEQRKDSAGLKRHSFGKFDFSNVASSNNLQQFTKYSRLQWQLL